MEVSNFHAISTETSLELISQTTKSRVGHRDRQEYTESEQRGKVRREEG
jgi:hypothetical protein